MLSELDNLLKKELNIEAMLACAFARCSKMMRYIDSLYDSDKERFYAAARRSKRIKSRFISGSRLQTRLSAQKALGVIMEAERDENVRKELFATAKKAFKSAVSDINYCIQGEMTAVPLDMVIKAFQCSKDNSDDNLHDAIAIAFYLCKEMGTKIDKNTQMYKMSMPIIIGKEEGFLKPYRDILNDGCSRIGLKEQDLRTVMNSTFAICRGKYIAEIGSAEDLDPDLMTFFQAMWDVGQLDDVPVSMYENERFNATEQREIFQSYLMRAGDSPEYMAASINQYYICALMLRSLARRYKEAIAMVEEKSGIVQDTTQHRELVRMVNSLMSKEAEQKGIIENKQAQLNDLQLELDRTKKKLQSITDELEAEKAKVKALEELANDEKGIVEAESDDTAEAIDRGRKMKAVVFGGPPNWQAQVKKAADGYVCIETSDYVFDTKLIDNADVVVIKTDYMSHAQYRRIIERARKKNKKVIYCTNNVDGLLAKVGRVCGK